MEVIKSFESKEELPSTTESEEEIWLCPDCNGKATYIDKYDRFYCYSCTEYVYPVRRDELQTPMDAEMPEETMPEEAIEPEDPLDDEGPSEEPPSPLDDEPEPEPPQKKRGFFGRFKRRSKK